MRNNTTANEGIENTRKWLCNPENIHNCGECPMNNDVSDWQEAYPCGQYHCWVELNNREDEDD